ncbi:MAG: hypothetical protein JOZ78_05505 [Chroococcidiopsidaceae cyanobacterium CP_BM_ER_R8_30]|nr:hypothetical protein [Chroococcidiopsidaceae cyanobacterium CP_BM_ER_R8_30]
MKKIVSIALLSLATISMPLLFSQAARADEVYCHPVTDKQVSRNSANYPNAYAAGYQAGEQRFRDGVGYKPQEEGGEFARGFEDGYFNRPYNGPTVDQSITQKCDESGYNGVSPPSVVYYPYVVSPPVIYNYPNPAFNFDFLFGGWHHGWGYHRWGYRRW